MYVHYKLILSLFFMLPQMSPSYKKYNKVRDSFRLQRLHKMFCEQEAGQSVEAYVLFKKRLLKVFDGLLRFLIQ